MNCPFNVFEKIFFRCSAKLAAKIFVLVLGLFVLHIHPLTAQTNEDKQNHEENSRFDIFIHPPKNFERGNPLIKFIYSYPKGRKKIRLTLPANDEIRAYAEGFSVSVNGKQARTKIRGAKIVNPVFTKDVNLSPQNYEGLSVPSNKIYIIDNNWESMEFIPEGVRIHGDIFPKRGFHGHLIVNDSQISKQPIKWRSDQKPRIDTWVYVTHENKFGRDNPAVTVRYDYIADQGSIDFNLPAKHQIQHFRQLELHADGKKLNYKNEKRRNKINYSREATIKAGNSKTMTLDLSNIFDIPDGWEQLKVVPKGKAIPEGEDNVPLGFKGSTIIRDAPPETK